MRTTETPFSRAYTLSKYLLRLADAVDREARDNPLLLIPAQHMREIAKRPMDLLKVTR